MEGLRKRNSPKCTLSQNGYGAGCCAACAVPSEPHAGPPPCAHRLPANRNKYCGQPSCQGCSLLSLSRWSRGVTVSTLDSESSDHGSNPREAFEMSPCRQSQIYRQDLIRIYTSVACIVCRLTSITQPGTSVFIGKHRGRVDTHDLKNSTTGTGTHVNTIYYSYRSDFVEHTGSTGKRTPTGRRSQTRA